MNKPVYQGLSILEISKTITYEFWYYHIRPKYQCNAKLYYMDIDNFIICIKTEDVMKTLQMMLKKDLIHQIMKSIDHCLREKMKSCVY